MKEKLIGQLTKVRALFEETKSTSESLRIELSGMIESLLKYDKRYEDSWLGDWTNNTDLYRNNFKPTSSTKMKIDENHIIKDLEKLSGYNIDGIKDKIDPIINKFFKLQEFTLSELSIIKDIPSYENDTELLKQIENFKWGLDLGSYRRSKQPRIAVVNPSQLNRSFDTPPHIEVGEKIIYNYSLLTSFNNFESLVNRLLRSIEIKTNVDYAANNETIPNTHALRYLFERFHQVATQLKNRYNNRKSLAINDEYDVQDLLNALLRINFEDIRKEEYTPSYAGGSTRIDFLLKREQIVLEVKKTRANLKDKEIGAQLILDIAHYRSHPDCKKLICFVYDPENRLINPRGLEDDLNKNSTDEMIVEVYIRP